MTFRFIIVTVGLHVSAEPCPTTYTEAAPCVQRCRRFRGSSDIQIASKTYLSFMCKVHFKENILIGGKPADERQHSFIQFTPFLRSVNPH